MIKKDEYNMTCYEEMAEMRKTISNDIKLIKQLVFNIKIDLTSEEVTKLHVFNNLDRITQIANHLLDE